MCSVEDVKAAAEAFKRDNVLASVLAPSPCMIATCQNQPFGASQPASCGAQPDPIIIIQ